MMASRQRTSVALALAVLAQAALTSGPAASQEVERFSLTGDVAIFNIAGNVEVEPGTAGGVVIELRRGGRDAQKLSVETGGLEGWQTLRVIYPDNDVVYPRLRGRSRTQFNVSDDGTFGRRWREGDDFPGLVGLLRLALGERGRGRVTVTGSGGGLEAWADIRVLVPAGQTVAVHVGVGEVRATNVRGNLMIDARSAPITANNLAGSARLATGSGTVELDGAEGDVVIDSGSGRVRVANVSGSRLSLDTGSGSVVGQSLRAGSVDIDTGSGGVQLTSVVTERLVIDTGSGGVRVDDSEAGELEVDTGSGSVTVDLRTSPRTTNIDTGSGAVTLIVPGDFGAVIDLSSGSGNVSSDLPVQIQSQRRSALRGTIGDGSGRVSIDTGSGGIRIRSRDP